MRPLSTVNSCLSVGISVLFGAVGCYLWSTGETSQSITVSESGLYEATVSSPPANEGSLSFDGDDDWVEAATIDLTGHPFNIEGWIKVPSVSHAHQTNVIDNYVFGSGGSDRWGVYVGGLEDDDMGFGCEQFLQV